MPLIVYPPKHYPESRFKQFVFPIQRVKHRLLGWAVQILAGVDPIPLSAILYADVSVILAIQALPATLTLTNVWMTISVEMWISTVSTQLAHTNAYVETGINWVMTALAKVSVDNVEGINCKRTEQHNKPLYTSKH